jgi:hypothetical protein
MRKEYEILGCFHGHEDFMTVCYAEGGYRRHEELSAFVFTVNGDSILVFLQNVVKHPLFYTSYFSL